MKTSIIHTVDTLEIKNPDGLLYSALYQGDNKNVLARLKNESIDCVVQDEPYGLNAKKINIKKFIKSVLAEEDYLRNGKGIGGKKWDADVPPLSHRKELYRVLKPGGYAVVFTGHKNIDLVMIGLRQAGFKIVDLISWVHCQGVPKGKKLDHEFSGQYSKYIGSRYSLAPSMELIILAMKPKSEKTLVENQKIKGVGLLNIRDVKTFSGELFPKNTIFEDSKCVKNWAHNKFNKFHRLGWSEVDDETHEATGQGQVVLFSKPSSKERAWGLESELEEDSATDSKRGLYRKRKNKAKNSHLTVKPISLMRYLIRLVSFEGAVVLDAYSGSGTTGIAALLENRRFIGIEISPEFFSIASNRIKNIYLEKETDIKKRQEQELIKSYKQDILNCQTDAEKQFLKDHLNLKICELYFYNIDRKIAS